MDSEKTPLLTKENGAAPDRRRRKASRESRISFSTSVKQVSHEHRMNRRFLLGCVMMTQFFDKMICDGLNGGLVLFCTNVLLFTSAQAATVELLFMGMAYMMQLLGGWVADSVAGRYNTVLGFGMVYIIGLTLIPISTFDFARYLGTDSYGRLLALTLDAKRGFFLTGVVLAAIGTGGFMVNLGPMGAQQVEDLGGKAIQSYFGWFYWFVNAGSGLAFSLVVYLQQEVSFFIGFTSLTVAIIIALIIFSLGKHRYILSPPTGSVMTTVFEIVWEGIQRKSKNKHQKLKSFLEYAKEDNGGTFPAEDVEGVRAFGRIIPVFIPVVLYYTVYAQMSSTFTQQAIRMNLYVGRFRLPAASLTLFDIIIILVLVPVMDGIIYPALARCGKLPTQLQRMGFGIFLAATSMAAAGVLEILRKHSIAADGGIIQDVGGTQYTASTINVMWQIPQFLLIGASEVFAVISGQEFAYSQSPDSLKGVVMGMFLLTTGLGHFLGSALLNLVNAATASDPWYPNEINDGHAENFFFLLAGLMGVNLLLFLVIAYRYKYVKLDLLIEEVDIDTADTTTVVKSLEKTASVTLKS